MVIADSGFWLGLLNPRDGWHQRATACFRGLGKEPLITTWPVIAEVAHLAARRAGHRAQQVFLRGGIEGLYTIFDLTPQHLPRIVELMERYASLPMDLADASLVILAEHLGHGRILSTDQRDFGAYRWKSREPFDNLLA